MLFDQLSYICSLLLVTLVAHFSERRHQALRHAGLSGRLRPGAGLPSGELRLLPVWPRAGTGRRGGAPLPAVSAHQTARSHPAGHQGLPGAHQAR